MQSKEIRKKLGYSQKDLSEQYGIPISTVKNWDSRECMPPYIYAMLEEIERLRTEKAFWKKMGQAL